MNDKHCLFVGHIVYGKNNIYEESLLDKLSKCSASLEVVSVNKSKEWPDRDENKRIKKLRTVRKPVIDEAVRFFDFLFFGLKWCRKHKRDHKVVILLSAPVEINLAAVWIKRFCNVSIVNLIIDTALGNIQVNNLLGKYTRYCYRRSENLCRKMTASMALNQRVFSYLQLEHQPCLHTRIGHNLESANFSYVPAKQKKILVYTGTLIYYDGTRELLEAVSMLSPEEYELHIYGRGPEEAIVKKYEREFPHIQFKGYLPNSKVKEILSNADLLINPRIDNEATDIFGFPSKMIEYLLSGTPVLTTKFAAMPDAYAQFVHLIEQQDGQGIAEAIQKVFAWPDQLRRQMCEKAYNYILSNNSYEQIVKEMMCFFDII